MGVDPYAPESAIVAGQGVTWKDFTPPSAAAILILPPDPHRLWFSVLQYGTNQFIGPLVQPWGDQPTVGWGLYQSGLPVLFHNASYPGLISLNWYLSGANGSTYRVVWYSTKDT